MKDPVTGEITKVPATLNEVIANVNEIVKVSEEVYMNSFEGKEGFLDILKEAGELGYRGVIEVEEKDPVTGEITKVIYDSDGEKGIPTGANINFLRWEWAGDEKYEPSVDEYFKNFLAEGGFNDKISKWEEDNDALLEEVNTAFINANNDI